MESTLVIFNFPTKRQIERACVCLSVYVCFLFQYICVSVCIYVCVVSFPSPKVANTCEISLKSKKRPRPAVQQGLSQKKNAKTRHDIEVLEKCCQYRREGGGGDVRLSGSSIRHHSHTFRGRKCISFDDNPEDRRFKHPPLICQA